MSNKTMKLPFSKYEGAGNNFIFIDMTTSQYDITPQQIQDMCRWKTGVGADGLVMLKESLLPECRYRYVHYVPMTGAEGSLCGNGTRCSLQFAEQIGLIKLEDGGTPIFFEAYDGVHIGRKLSSDKYYINIRDVSFKSISKLEQNYYFINNGTPHYVRFVEDVHGDEVSPDGLDFRHTESCCVNFVQVTSEGDVSSIAVRTWEGGLEEETEACGTGATASAIVAFLHQHDFRTPDGRKGSGQSSVMSRVSMRGGELGVRFTVGEQVVSDIGLSGPVRHVFNGSLCL
ncbi:hypothetical protein ACOMHN_032809 [Nucella lapillus]